jgi:hypothetical protein
MAHVSYQDSLYQRREVPIEAQQNLFLKNSLRYANRFHRYAGAIVPRDCYPQTIVAQGDTIRIFHAALPVDLNLSRCSTFLWSARHGAIDHVIDSPDNLEVFVVLTCGEANGTDEDGHDIILKVCDILFPGIWATQLWKKHLCLWYRHRSLLATNPKFPEGLLYADHMHLQNVLGDFATI